MAGKEGPAGKVGNILDLADHPLMFAFAITLLVIPMMALMTVLFSALGWPGPQSLVQQR